MGQVRINGVEHRFDKDMPSDLAALLRQLGVDSATVVAEVDGRIIRRDEFEKTPLRAGQTIELIRFVGGG